MSAAVSFRTDAFCFCAKALCRLGLDLARFARLDVVTAAPDLTQDPGLHHAALEALQRPVDAIGFVQMDFDHRSSTGVRWGSAALQRPNPLCSGAPIRSLAVGGRRFNDRAWRRSRLQ